MFLWLTIIYWIKVFSFGLGGQLPLHAEPFAKDSFYFQLWQENCELYNTEKLSPAVAAPVRFRLRLP